MLAIKLKIKRKINYNNYINIMSKKMYNKIKKNLIMLIYIAIITTNKFTLSSKQIMQKNQLLK